MQTQGEAAPGACMEASSEPDKILCTLECPIPDFSADCWSVFDRHQYKLHQIEPAKVT